LKRTPQNVAAAVVALATPAPAWSDDRYWSNPAGGDFATGANWLGGVAPGPGDTAVFDLGGAYTVRVATDASIGGLTVRDRVVVDLGDGRTLSLETGEALREFIVGAPPERDTLLRIVGGTVAVPHGSNGVWEIATAPGTAATLEIADRGRIFLADRWLHTGPSSHLVIDGGYISYPGWPYLGAVGLSGRVDVLAGSISGDHVAMRSCFAHIAPHGAVYSEGSINADAATTITLDGGILSAYDFASFDGPVHGLNGGTVSGGGYNGGVQAEECLLEGPRSIVWAGDVSGNFTLRTGARLHVQEFGALTGTVVASDPGTLVEVEGTSDAVVRLNGGATGRFNVIRGRVDAAGAGTTLSGEELSAAGQVTLTDGAMATADVLGVYGSLTFADGATLAATTRIEIYRGVLSGAGRVTAPRFLNGGVLAPAAGPEPLLLQGDYAQWWEDLGYYVGPGVLAVTITGVDPAQAGLLEVTGEATLDGQLSVALAPGVVLPPGATFTVLRAATVTGRFDTVSLPPLPAGREWRVSYGTGEVALRVVATGCRADLDGDGAAGIGDLFAFLRAYSAGEGLADFNADGALNIADLLAFLEAFAAGC
jgi:hypothetical protein